MKNSALAESILAELNSRGETLASAESLTGGMIGALLTDVPGSSASYLGGVISYATRLKATLAGVDRSTLVEAGPVAERTAAEMARGVARHYAGPTGAWRQPAWPGLRFRTATRSARSSCAVSYQTGELLRASKNLRCTATVRLIRQQAASAALALLAEALGLNSTT